MSTSTLPEEKYAHLKAAYPADWFPFFFEGQELNFAGQLALQRLKAVNILAASTFIFDPDKETVSLIIPSAHLMDISSEAGKESVETAISGCMLNEFGIKDMPVRLTTLSSPANVAAQCE
jgi:hypothetical protein